MTTDLVAQELLKSIRPFIKSVRYSGTRPSFRKSPASEEFEKLLNTIYDLILDLQSDPTESVPV